MLTALIVILSIVLLLWISFLWHKYWVLPVERKGQVLCVEVASVLRSPGELDSVPGEQIEELARRPETRGILYRLLDDFKRTDLFPERYASEEQIAESDLVVQLAHPRQLNVVPDETELVLTVEREKGDPPRRYKTFVFRFRVSPPHPAAGEGWMVGMAGPYWEDEAPRYAPPGLFHGNDLVLKRLL